jgi:2,3-dihydro-2,3-dihydroxybenzoate dehydrogenase
MSDTGLGGKIALVTGAAGGIGAAVVRGLLAEGSIVVAADRDVAGLSALARERPGDPHLHTSALDVCRPADIALLLDSIEDGLGPVDLGVLVAGVLSTTRVVETEDETWRRVFAVNVDGVFNVSKALARRMIPRRRGALVTVSSNAAGIPRYGMAAYAASKAAATMLTRCLGLEVAEYGIRCNIVAPGSTRTPMQDAMWAAGSSAAAVIDGSLETFRSGIPLRKMAEPREVADAVVFLLSDQASHITMTDLYVDGGATLRG